MRVFITILANFLIPPVVGGFIFGIVTGAIVTLHNGDLGKVLPGILLMAFLSSIFGFLFVLLPALAYSLVMGALSASISAPRLRRRVLVGVALVAGFTLFPLTIWQGGTGFKDAWWIIALISGPVFAWTAYLFDKLPADRPTPSKSR